MTRKTVDINCLSGQTYTVPLVLAVGEEQQQLFNSDGVTTERSNFVVSPGLFPEATGRVSPSDVFHWTYAILHCPTYRFRYAAELRRDFPNVPIPKASDLFETLAERGRELSGLHLLESATLENYITITIGSGDFEVEKVSYSDETIWIDKAKTRGFKGVPEKVWNFHIGGYQVCEKWLKDRGPKKGNPGRVLTDKDIDHYQKIVVALAETIRIMGEIDEVIEGHGGWPDAFATTEN